MGWSSIRRIQLIIFNFVKKSPRYKLRKKRRSEALRFKTGSSLSSSNLEVWNYFLNSTIVKFFYQRSDTDIGLMEHPRSNSLW